MSLVNLGYLGAVTLVPGDIYNDFKPQNFTTKSGEISQSTPTVVSSMKQYALKFDLIAAKTGSPRVVERRWVLDLYFVLLFYWVGRTGLGLLCQFCVRLL